MRLGGVRGSVAVRVGGAAPPARGPGALRPRRAARRAWSAPSSSTRCSTTGRCPSSRRRTRTSSSSGPARRSTTGSPRPGRRVRRVRLEPAAHLRVGADDVDARCRRRSGGSTRRARRSGRGKSPEADATTSTSPTTAAASTPSGYPAISTVGHLVSLAELVTLAGAVFVLLMLLRSAGGEPSLVYPPRVP